MKLIEVVRRWRGFDHLRGVPLRPQLGDAVVLLAVLSVLGGDRADQGVGGVAVAEQGADGEQDLRDGQCWRPLVFQNVKTDTTVRVDIAVVNPRCEVHFGRLEWIVCREVDVQEEDTSCVRRILWSHNGCLPRENIFRINWTC